MLSSWENSSSRRFAVGRCASLTTSCPLTVIFYLQKQYHFEDEYMVRSSSTWLENLRIWQYKQTTYSTTIETLRVTIFDVEKQYEMFSERVSVTLATQHAMRMRCIHCRLWPVRLYLAFPYYLINVTIFGKNKNLLDIKYIFWFSLQIRLKHLSV
jgi:hypothetical protein